MDAARAMGMTELQVLFRAEFPNALPVMFGGAVFQEAIDLAAVLNALRAAVPGGELSDY